MATPVAFTDAVTTFTAANLNKFLCVGEADHVATKLLFARVRYTGSAWEVHGSTDAAGLTALALSWDAGSSQLDIALTGFTAAPVVLGSAIADDNAYHVKAHASAADAAALAFFDAAGDRVETEDANMDCCLLVIGA
jgi:hypothetical protein